MTLTIPLWAIPTVLTILAVVAGTLKAINDMWEEERLAPAIFLALSLTYIIWTTYFTILYFVK